MSPESSPTTNTPQVSLESDAERTWADQPWVTWLVSAACVGIFVGLAYADDYESWETLARFGYLNSDAVWRGSYWALVTSAFVHFDLWHVVLNVYWLWVLGSRLERSIGSLRYCLFIISAAHVSSAFQLAASGDTGIGASGVVYAIFGFMWVARRRYPSFAEAVTPRTIQLFLIWLAVCVVATYLEIWPVGNAAHISGLLFGAAVAGAFALQYQRRLMFAGLSLLIVCSIVPLVWCPWSVGWLSIQAYNAHLAERYQESVEYYSQIIRLDPDNAWAHLNRSSAFQTLGELERAQVDFERALEIDPTIYIAE